MFKKIYSIQTQKKSNTVLPCSCSVYYILLSHCYKVSTTLQKKLKRDSERKIYPSFIQKQNISLIYTPHPLQKKINSVDEKNAFFLLPFCLYFAPNIIYYTTKTKHQIILVKLTTIYEKNQKKDSLKKKNEIKR